MDLPNTLLGWLMFGGFAALISLTAIGVRSGIAFAQANIQHVLFERLCKWAATYVTALEQSPDLKGLASEEKKERAMLWLRLKAEEFGIDLSVEEASKLIEQAVFLMKKALPHIEDQLDPVG